MNTGLTVRPALLTDAAPIADMKAALWPDGDRGAHLADSLEVIDRPPPARLPIALFIAEVDNGGCDLLTSCTNTPGSRTCGPCPEGFTGDGESGCVEAATEYGYTEFFTSGEISFAQCDTWRTFLPGIPDSGFTRVRYFGSADPVGVTCSDPLQMAAIADGMRAASSFSVTCDGRIWSMCARNDGEFGIDPPATCSGANCPNGYLLRPCFLGAAFWGAVAGPTCGGAPSQTISLIFD